jgi:hypothetical protein
MFLEAILPWNLWVDEDELGKSNTWVLSRLPQIGCHSTIFPKKEMVWEKWEDIQGGFSKKSCSARIPIVMHLVDKFGNMVLSNIMLLCFHVIQTYLTSIK